MTTEPAAVGTVAAGVVGRLTAEALARADLATEREARDRIGDVLAMAGEWRAGRRPLAEVGRRCTPQDRFLAVRFGPRPIPAALLAVIDALIDAVPGPDGYAYRTRFGVFTEADVAAAKGTYRREADGTVVIAFPLRVARGEEASGWQ